MEGDLACHHWRIFQEIRPRCIDDRDVIFFVSWPEGEQGTIGKIVGSNNYLLWNWPSWVGHSLLGAHWGYFPSFHHLEDVDTHAHWTDYRHETRNAKSGNRSSRQAVKRTCRAGECRGANPNLVISGMSVTRKDRQKQWGCYYQTSCSNPYLISSSSTAGVRSPAQLIRREKDWTDIVLSNLSFPTYMDAEGETISDVK